MKNFYLFLSIVFCVFLSLNEEANASHWRTLEDETVNNLLVCAEASSRAYETEDTIRNENPYLSNNNFNEFHCCDETEGVYTVGWFNENSKQLIIAHRGTVITETKNLLADLGIIEAMVRGRTTDLTSLPSGQDVADFLTGLVESNIKKFNGIDDFRITDLGVKEGFFVKELLNLDRLYLRRKNAYAAGGGLLGVAVTGVVTFIWPPSLMVTIPALMASAGVGGSLGAWEAERETQAYALKPGRTALANTLEIMYSNTTTIIEKAEKKQIQIGEIILTGHSLGGEGVLAVASRLKPAREDLDLSCFVFNSPGGHRGVVKIWQEEIEEKWDEIPDQVPIWHVHRTSCLVANAGTLPGHVTDLPRGAFYKDDDKSIQEWYGSRLQEHGIKLLNREVHDYLSQEGEKDA